VAAEQAPLHVEQPAIAELIPEYGMSDLLSEAPSNPAIIFLRPDGERAQARPARTKSLGLISPLLTAVITTESERIGRNGSIMSSASAGRP
jgi:hypothetical protein